MNPYWPKVYCTWRRIYRVRNIPQISSYITCRDMPLSHDCTEWHQWWSFHIQISWVVEIFPRGNLWQGTNHHGDGTNKETTQCTRLCCQGLVLRSVTLSLIQPKSGKVNFPYPALNIPYHSLDHIRESVAILNELLARNKISDLLLD